MKKSITILLYMTVVIGTPFIAGAAQASVCDTVPETVTCDSLLLLRLQNEALLIQNKELADQNDDYRKTIEKYKKPRMLESENERLSVIIDSLKQETERLGSMLQQLQKFRETFVRNKASEASRYLAMSPEEMTSDSLNSLIVQFSPLAEEDSLICSLRHECEAMLLIKTVYDMADSLLHANYDLVRIEKCVAAIDSLPSEAMTKYPVIDAMKTSLALYQESIGIFWNVMDEVASYLEPYLALKEKVDDQTLTDMSSDLMKQYFEYESVRRKSEKIGRIPYLEEKFRDYKYNVLENPLGHADYGKEIKEVRDTLKGGE